MINPRDYRPFIHLNEVGTVLHDEKPCRVELRRDVISVGCTDISIAAARYLVGIHEQHFPVQREAFVIQTGELPRP